MEFPSISFPKTEEQTLHSTKFTFSPHFLTKFVFFEIIKNKKKSFRDYPFPHFQGFLQKIFLITKQITQKLPLIPLMNKQSTASTNREKVIKKVNQNKSNWLEL